MVVILALVVVLFLAIVLIGLAKKVFAGSGGIGGRSRAPRLAVLDMAPVDPKRKLVLVRRDDVEHLILIGGQNDLVVEPGILRGQARRPRQEPGFAEPEQRPAPPQQALPHRRTPRPSVQPIPSEAQTLGSHPPIAPVAEDRTDPGRAQRAEPAQRALEPTGDRAVSRDVREPGSVAAMAPLSPEQRVEPVAPPAAPIVVPPAPPVVTPSRMADEPPAPRRVEATLPPEPTPSSRRGHDPSVEAPQAAAPAPRSFAPTAMTDAASRRPDPTAPVADRVDPPLVPPETTRQVPIVPPIVPPRPVAPPVAQTVVPSAPNAPPVAPTVTPPTPAAPSAPASVGQAGANPSSPPSQPTAPMAPPPVQPPVAPRSMATPTLPQLSRATPVAPQPRTEPEVTPARSLWSPAPSVTAAASTVDTSGDTASRPERDASQTNPPLTAAPMPERVPVRWPPAPVAPKRDEAAKAEVGFAGPAAEPAESTPAPLSVKSFATTIQERRTVAAPAEAPSVPPARPPYSPQAQTASAPPPIAVAPAIDREPDPAPSKVEDGERPLTLEEEMERLLHDFTIDVSERR